MLFKSSNTKAYISYFPDKLMESPQDQLVYNAIAYQNKITQALSYKTPEGNQKASVSGNYSACPSKGFYLSPL